MSSELTRRTLTALVTIPLLIAILYVAAQYQVKAAVGVLFAVIAAVCAGEYQALLARCQIRFNRLAFVVTVAALELALVFLNGDGRDGLWLLAAFLPLAWHLGRAGREVAQTLLAWAFGVLYIPYLLHYAYLVYLSADGFAAAVFVLILVWIYDSGAYFAGRRWGRRRIAPGLSPKKSWEGVAAGLAGTMLVSVLLGPWLTKTPWAPSVIIAVIIGCAAQWGDLLESALKRFADVKDAGALFPGHGGMLDRIDALLFAFPAYYFSAPPLVHIMGRLP